MAGLSLSELLGSTVMDANGNPGGKLREVAIAPQEDQARIAVFVVRTKQGERVLPYTAVSGINGGLKAKTAVSEWGKPEASEGLLFLERDLLDQQVIDVHGRKVVRVNDVDLYQDPEQHPPVLRVSAVDVGTRGAIRRLLKGVVPQATLRTLLQRIPPRAIPWEFVDLIETDPARRVKLKISHDRLAQLHPADIADIVEELAPDEREAVFETLDEEVAAEALEEVNPRLQKRIVESLDSDRAADIVEEMNPDAAADLLGDLPEERTEAILQEMEPEERDEVVELLEFQDDTAAGRMNTDYLSLDFSATVEGAIEKLRHFEGGIESISTIFLTDSHGTLVGVVPLPKIVLAKPKEPLLALVSEPLVSCDLDTSENEVAELMDKYNLAALPVVDEHKQLVGIITADDVISFLRHQL